MEISSREKYNEVNPFDGEYGCVLALFAMSKIILIQRRLNYVPSQNAGKAFAMAAP